MLAGGWGADGGRSRRRCRHGRLAAAGLGGSGESWCLHLRAYGEGAGVVRPGGVCSPANGVRAESARGGAVAGDARVPPVVHTPALHMINAVGGSSAAAVVHVDQGCRRAGAAHPDGDQRSGCLCSEDSLDSWTVYVAASK